MSEMIPGLWYEGDSESSAEFYVRLIVAVRIDRVLRSRANISGGSVNCVRTVASLSLALVIQPSTVNLKSSLIMHFHFRLSA